jgi:predicted GIY-YIG superfamily endonuclease
LTLAPKDPEITGDAGNGLHPGFAAERHALYRRNQQRRRAPHLRASRGTHPGLHQAARCEDAGLVWLHQSISTAIAREKNIKGWPRRWKLDLINKMNPDWEDLFWHLG